VGWSCFASTEPPMIILGEGTRQMWPGPAGPGRDLRARLAHHPAGLVVPVVPAPSDGEEPLSRSPGRRSRSRSVPGPGPPRRHGHRRARRTRRPGRGQGRTPRSSRPRVTGERGVAVAPGSPVSATGRACGVFSIELAISAHVRLLGGTERVVHAIAPGTVEVHPVGRIGRQELRLGTSRRRATSSALVASPHRSRWSPSARARPVSSGGSARLLQCLVEVERLRPLPLLPRLQ